MLGPVRSPAPCCRGRAATWAARRRWSGPGPATTWPPPSASGLRPGDLALSLGTSGTVYAVTDAPTADPSGAVAGFADATGRFLPLVCTLNATKVTDTVARLLGVGHRGVRPARPRRRRRGPTASTLLPYLDGERTPNRPRATGALTGLRAEGRTRATWPGPRWRACVCGLLDGYDALAARSAPRRTVTTWLVGGGARSAAYRQVLADLTGRPWLAVQDDEMVARGAALQAAAVAAGTTVDQVASAWGRPGSMWVEPGPGSGDAWGVRSAYAQVRDRA